MKGVLFDADIIGHAAIMPRLLAKIGLPGFMDALGVRLSTFADFGLHTRTDDRTVWKFCQAKGLVLYTNNRNMDGEDSLEYSIRDLYTTMSLPVITLANKKRFETEESYAVVVADRFATLLFDIFERGMHRGACRIYIPE